MTARQTARKRRKATGKPLVVDLDGTLVRSDLLIEAAFAELGRQPLAAGKTAAALFRGKAALKHHLALADGFDPASLPYDSAVLAFIRSAKDEGRPVYLASAGAERSVRAVGEYIGLFDGIFASSATHNLAGQNKAKRLVEEFGIKGFDYIGNDPADLDVWAQADEAITIRANGSVRERLAATGQPVRHLAAERPTLRTWLKLLRVHQYAKNSLVLVPLFVSHSFNAASIGLALAAAVAFSLCASSVYILNDLVDLAADRQHPTKRNRPLANGSIPLAHGVAAGALLLVIGLAIAAAVSLPFLGVLIAYLGITTAYSLMLKRKLIADVISLATLYTIRVIGGAVAIAVVPSHWLLAFSVFIFTSLALIKRYIELAVRLDAGLPDPTNRNYRIGDMDVVIALAAAAGMNAMTVLTLYINDAARAEPQLYSKPYFLWLMFPLLTYWISRALVMAHRRAIDDDPIVFALRDRISRYTVLCMALVVILAI